MDKIAHKGTLYLIPSLLGEGPVENSIPANNTRMIESLKYFIVEEVRTARRFIKKVSPGFNLDEAHFSIFNEHSDKAEIHSYLTPLREGNHVGILSEAGIPCIADPGAEIVALAQQQGMRVIPLTGPSSLFLALMASGFNGQNFAFHGYLPIEKGERVRKIKEIEKQVFGCNQTQIFIETPYRNRQLFEALLSTCNENLLLCLACDLTLDSEFIKVKSIREWRKANPEINKRPVVFLLYK